MDHRSPLWVSISSVLKWEVEYGLLWHLWLVQLSVSQNPGQNSPKLWQIHSVPQNPPAPAPAIGQPEKRLCSALALLLPGILGNSLTSREDVVSKVWPLDMAVNCEASKVQWLTAVILATPEAKVGGVSQKVRASMGSIFKPLVGRTGLDPGAAYQSQVCYSVINVCVLWKRCLLTIPTYTHNHV